MYRLCDIIYNFYNIFTSLSHIYYYFLGLFVDTSGCGGTRWRGVGYADQTGHGSHAAGESHRNQGKQNVIGLNPESSWTQGYVCISKVECSLLSVNVVLQSANEILIASF